MKTKYRFVTLVGLLASALIVAGCSGASTSIASSNAPTSAISTPTPTTQTSISPTSITVAPPTSTSVIQSATTTTAPTTTNSADLQEALNVYAQIKSMYPTLGPPVLPNLSVDGLDENIYSARQQAALSTWGNVATIPTPRPTPIITNPAESYSALENSYITGFENSGNLSNVSLIDLSACPSADFPNPIALALGANQYKGLIIYGDELYSISNAEQYWLTGALVVSNTPTSGIGLTISSTFSYYTLNLQQMPLSSNQTISVPQIVSSALPSNIHVMYIAGSAFSTSTLTCTQGDTVNFIDTDAVSYEVSVSNNTTINTSPSGTGQYVFSKAGTFTISLISATIINNQYIATTLSPFPLTVTVNPAS